MSPSHHYQKNTDHYHVHHEEDPHLLPPLDLEVEDSGSPFPGVRGDQTFAMFFTQCPDAKRVIDNWTPGCLIAIHCNQYMFVVK